MNGITQYREMAQVHAKIDYGDPASVKRGNEAADSLRKLGRNKLGSDELLHILTEKHPSSLWAAHHLLEFHELSDDQIKLSIRRIEEEVSKGGATAMGERMFLDEFTNGDNKTQQGNPLAAP